MDLHRALPVARYATTLAGVVSMLIGAGGQSDATKVDKSYSRAIARALSVRPTSSSLDALEDDEDDDFEYKTVPEETVVDTKTRYFTRSRLTTLLRTRIIAVRDSEHAAWVVAKASHEEAERQQLEAADALAQDDGGSGDGAAANGGGDAAGAEDQDAL